ncbi:hypothetical protein GT354_14965 [Streptomyces sp. SID3343]|nr:hypothetical protein [Streptomyces sp. SID3343]
MTDTGSVKMLVPAGAEERLVPAGAGERLVRKADVTASGAATDEAVADA